MYRRSALVIAALVAVAGTAAIGYSLAPASAAGGCEITWGSITSVTPAGPGLVTVTSDVHYCPSSPQQPGLYSFDAQNTGTKLFGSGSGTVPVPYSTQRVCLVIDLRKASDCYGVTVAHAPGGGPAEPVVTGRVPADGATIPPGPPTLGPICPSCFKTTPPASPTASPTPGSTGVVPMDADAADQPGPICPSCFKTPRPTPTTTPAPAPTTTPAPAPTTTG
jgi:hypothetical protein